MNGLLGLNTFPEREANCRWWRRLFDASKDAEMVCRADGVAVQVNPRAARQFNLQPEAAEGAFSIFQVLAPPADKKLERFLQQQNPRADTLHSVLTLREGAPHTMVDLELAPLGDGCTLVTFKDASRRLRLESHVQRLITAIDATPEVFFLADADLRLTFVNPAFQSTTGYSIEEVLGRPDAFLRASFEQEKVLAYLESVRQGQEWIGELVNLRRDGVPYHVEATISPISDMAGRFMGYVACERDVSLRIQLQEQLRIERDFVRSILQSLDGAIYSLDREFRLTHANDGWRSMPPEHGGLRVTASPSQGRSLLDYVPDPARREELRRVFQEVLDTGQTQDNRFCAPDGRHWILKISPWVDDQQVRGLICSVADQTQYHELQNQLFQSQKMEIIGTLAASVAHDFNNLLQAIRGNSGLILRQAAPDSALRREVEQIDLAAARAADITQQLLSFSREGEQKRTVLDLNQIIQEATQLARRTLRGNIALELRPAPDVLPVKMDSTRANQALLNLCVNAQDAMPEGGRLVLENTRLDLPPSLAERHGFPPDAAFARCSVTDTGTGIAADLLPRIFQPFFTTKSKGKGTGLGLPIVLRVAQEAGGFVDVESTLGKGTTFHLYLPLAQEQLTPVSTSALAPLAHGTGRVLVVDDVDLLREFTQSFLEAAGLSVVVADSGPAAIEILGTSAEPVDLVFTDYNMPGMNGLELIEEVARRWPAMRFVLASGYLDDAVRSRSERCNASVLSKPYDMRDASEIIMRKLATKAPEVAAPAA